MRIPARIAAVLLLSTAAVAAAATTRDAKDPRPPRLAAMTVTGHDDTDDETKMHGAEADTTEGTWTLSPNGRGGLQVNLHFGPTQQWGRPVDRADLVGLTDAQMGAAASTPVSFRMEREAGVFEMEGAFREGRGAGHFRFRPDRGFASTLRSLGVEGAGEITDRELMILALADASSAAVREYRALGLAPLDVEGVIQLSIHQVTPEYVREMRSLGLTGGNTVDDVVQLRIHRVSTEYVRELASLGYRDLSRDQLLEMGIHGVDAEHVRAIQELGFRTPTPRQLVDTRIHRVTPEYVRSMREAGFRDLSPEALVDMRIHRVTPEFIQGLAEAGYRDLTRDQLMQMGIHGVTPAFIREVREAGFRDLSPEALVRMKIHGIGAEYGRPGRRRAGA